jgi:peptidoglycan/LPS O-acetylase OafA/YrhL
MKVNKDRHAEPKAEQTPQRGTRRRDAAWVAAGAALIFGVILFDNDKGTGQLEFVIVLLGPLLTGLVMRLRGWPWRLGAASWALNGLVMLTYDWALNNEDQAFHAVLTLTMAALVALGAAIGHGLLALRSRAPTR